MQIGEVRIMVEVADLVTETGFWVDLLGFTITRSFDGGTMIGVGATTVEFFDVPGADSPKVSLSLEVDDVAERWAQWSNEAAVGFALRHNPWGDRSFSLISPAGIKVIFFQPD